MNGLKQKMLSKLNSVIHSIFLYALTLPLFFLNPALSENNDTPAIDIIRSQYFKVVEGKSTPSEGLSLLKGCDEEEQQLEYPPLFIAYCGSFLALEARDSYVPTRKWHKAQKALELLDFAVNHAPENNHGVRVEIVSLRVAVTHHLPFFFNRREQSRQDVAWLKNAFHELEAGELSSKITSLIGYYISSNSKN
jgi:hypothetical protein